LQYWAILPLAWFCGGMPTFANLLNLSLHQVPLTEVLFQLARHNGLNIVIHGDIKGSTSLNLQQIEAHQ
jgi:type II secretory pathway component HofQ